MTIRALLVGPGGQGGEGAYTGSLSAHPPPGVEYAVAGGFHAGAPGAPCQVVREVLLNRIVHPLAIPDMGFRALRMRERFDLVHVHAHPVRLGGLGSTPLVMSEGSSAAVYLAHYLGWDQDRLTRGFRRARRLYRALGIADRLLTLERASAVYVFSEWARQLNIRWGADAEKLRVIPPGFRTPLEIERPERGTYTFLFVGTDFERKGGFELVEAFDAVWRAHPHARLVLVGSDPWQRNPDRLVHSWVPAERRARALESLLSLERAGAAQHASWTGREALDREFVAADAFVMPTHAEGFGFTNVEAMSFGLPVITSTAGPAGEIVADGRTGIVMPAGDVHALRDAMLRLVTAPDDARRMGQAGRVEFVARFTRERFRTALGALYREVLTR
jgi:glycosyltransferase involved in cell wall biosynthesis